VATYLTGSWVFLRRYLISMFAIWVGQTPYCCRGLWDRFYCVQSISRDMCLKDFQHWFDAFIDAWKEMIHAAEICEKLAMCPRERGRRGDHHHVCHPSSRLHIPLAFSPCAFQWEPYHILSSTRQRVSTPIIPYFRNTLSCELLSRYFFALPASSASRSFAWKGKGRK